MTQPVLLLCGCGTGLDWLSWPYVLADVPHHMYLICLFLYYVILFVFMGVDFFHTTIIK